jgi:hypothetical protein
LFSRTASNVVAWREVAGMEVLFERVAGLDR